jgi:two-component system response regulator FlrC
MRLEHPSVSREHAELQRQGPIYALRNLSSTNGTHLNGVRTEHAALSEGDVIRCGEYLGVVCLCDHGEEESGFGELAPGLWCGPSLRRVLSSAETAARTDIPVVLVGPTGAGKEQVARAIHVWSGRQGRFHALNCSTLPTDLAEAELFGHQRGAFTGADRSRIGHLRAADTGTLFLDEVAELSLAVQAKLLRAVEQKEVVPLGETSGVPTDVRIVVAVHEPLERYVERGTFRADLNERFSGFKFELPPLRTRREEIPGLFFHLLRKHGADPLPDIEAKLLERLCLHVWTGNVRELELFTRKLLALHTNEPVLRAEFADGLLRAGEPTSSAAEPSKEKFRTRRESDLHRLNAALEVNGGNVSAAAASIGISRRRAYRLLDKEHA